MKNENNEKREFDKKRLAAGIALSSVTGSLLALHLLNENITFDNQALILIIVALIPWLSLFIDSTTLPGGVSFAFRKLKENQKIQEGRLDDAVKFLFAGLINEYEAAVLKKLNEPEVFYYDFNENFEKELYHLLMLGLIARQPGEHGVRSAKNDKREARDLKQHFRITDSGINYLLLDIKFRDEESEES